LKGFLESRRGDVNMKPISWVGIVLIVLGALALAYQGINYTRQKKVLDVGSVHVTKETHERIPLPPILGGLALAGGVVLLVMGTRN
jgi:drug/metabolite transporter (DMT)-like permease